jgi:hypothetical protein
MRLRRLFRIQKSRKYPIKRDEYGRSARSRCFEMFPKMIPLKEIAKETRVSVETIQRYHRQWKQNPNFEGQLRFVKSLFDTKASLRDENIKIYSKALGITPDNFEEILFQPHGLKRLMQGKIYTPAKESVDHKIHIAFAFSMLISDHIMKNQGSFEDVYNTFKRWMPEYAWKRQEEDEEITEENKFLAYAHMIIAAAAKQEHEGRIKPDQLSEEEVNAILRYAGQRELKNVEVIYWFRIGTMMAEGLTKEQAREKIFQDLIAKGDLKGAKIMREFQDRIHPLKNDNKS